MLVCRWRRRRSAGVREERGRQDSGGGGCAGRREGREPFEQTRGSEPERGATLEIGFGQAVARLCVGLGERGEAGRGHGDVRGRAGAGHGSVRVARRRPRSSPSTRTAGPDPRPAGRQANPRPPRLSVRQDQIQRCATHLANPAAGRPAPRRSGSGGETVSGRVRSGSAPSTRRPTTRGTSGRRTWNTRWRCLNPCGHGQ